MYPIYKHYNDYTVPTEQKQEDIYLYRNSDGKWVATLNPPEYSIRACEQSTFKMLKDNGGVLRKCTECENHIY